MEELSLCRVCHHQTHQGAMCEDRTGDNVCLRVSEKQRERGRKRKRDKTGQDDQKTMFLCMALRISETELGLERLEVMGLASGHVRFLSSLRAVVPKL